MKTKTYFAFRVDRLGRHRRQHCRARRWRTVSSMTAGLLRISLVLPLLLSLWVTSAANAQSQSGTTNPAWLELYHRLHEECVEYGFPGAIAGCLLEKDKEYGKELDQAYRKALTLAETNKPLLRESQRSWLKYQESTCKLYEVLMTFEGPGIARRSAAGCLLGMTLQRLEELRWMADCFNRRCAD
jgi:uncharacterized protein YecT (DUF1311 family)